MALPAALRDAILAQARAAYPTECCGLLVGSTNQDHTRVTALHPAQNLSRDPRRFQIDPIDHITAQKAARAEGLAVVGCYHSHPGGRAEPSATDLAGASEEGFLWLIAAEDELAAFRYLRGRFTGAEWVTSDS